MTARPSSTDRDVVPRWRSVRRTIAAGEFQQLPRPRELSLHHKQQLKHRHDEWAAESTTVSAAELVTASRIAGEPAPGQPALLLAEVGETETLRRLGRSILEADSDVHEQLEDHDLRPKTFYYERIHLVKARLVTDPRSALRWAELARAYTALGQFEHAADALRIARTLAPTSRYLLRISARFFVHSRRPDLAFRLLDASPRTQHDPWLMAAFLSVASNGGIPVRSLRPARRIIDDDNFRAIERSELVSEVATFDLRAGTDRRARQLFNRSLETPTDNSLAQVEWASHRMANLSVPLKELDVPYAAEAHARSAAQEGNWSDALIEAVRWQRDQPFDAEAATFASYVALTGVEDFNIGELTASAGLQARPDDPALLNNLAYAQIHLDKLTEAADTLRRAPSRATDTADAIALTATRGLLAFREGDVARGRTDYGEAIEMSRKARLRSLESMARAMLASEELRAGVVEDIDGLLRLVVNAAEGVDDPGVRVVVHRLQQASNALRRP